MSNKSVIRKHSAKCLKVVATQISLRQGETLHYVLIGGLWYYNGNSELALSDDLRYEDGFWKDTITTILNERSGTSLETIMQIHKPSKCVTYMRHWTTEQVMYGVPF